MIIPFPPGGGNDIVGRVVATVLTERLGKQVIVDNRAGAGGVVGTELAANAPKDGYTLLVVSLAHTVNPWLYELKPYDPIKSFAPIAMSPPGRSSGRQSESRRSRSRELVALAKKQPGKLQYASGRRRQLDASRRRAVQNRRRASTCCMSRSAAAVRPSSTWSAATPTRVRRPAHRDAAGPLGQAACAGGGVAKRHPTLPDVPRSPKPACRAMKPSTGRAGRAGRHAGRHRRAGCTRRSRRYRTLPRCRSSSTPMARESCP